VVIALQTHVSWLNAEYMQDDMSAYCDLDVSVVQTLMDTGIIYAIQGDR